MKTNHERCYPKHNHNFLSNSIKIAVAGSFNPHDELGKVVWSVNEQRGNEFRLIRLPLKKDTLLNMMHSVLNVNILSKSNVMDTVLKPKQDKYFYQR